jgi:hypothetical protein
MHLRPRITSAPLRLLLLVAMLASFGPAAALAVPTPGFLEEWTGNTSHGWGSGGSVISNPGTGGYLGAGDGYLQMQTTVPTGRLGTFSLGNEYLGDWVTPGITKVGVWLNDVGNDDPVEVHFSIGHAQINFWQYDIAFVPPHNQWAQYVVDLSSDANWTRTQGEGTFVDALASVDRVHWRHDLAPYVMEPDLIQADVGIDHMLMTDGVAGVLPPASVRAPVELSPPVPNPSRGPVSLVVRAPEPGTVRVEIVDAAGRSVRRATIGGASGLRVWLWDGRDDAGTLVAPGVYRARAVGSSGGTSRSLIRVQ